MNGIINKCRRLLECGKDGQSNRKPSTFQQRHIALFIFDISLRHACKAKEAVVWTRVNLLPGAIHLQCTARNTDGVEQRIDGHIGAEILATLNSSMIYK